jgi:type I restriction enzyme S subunit
VLSGFAFDSEGFGDSGDVPVVRIRDVVPGSSSTFYRGAFDPRYIVGNGDILIGMDGEFNRARWRDGRALLNQRVCRIAPSGPDLDEGYLFYFLPAALKAIERVTPFVTVKHLSVKQIRDIAVPLPPLPEQRRIAEILDKADTLRAKRRAALAQLDTLTQSIFLDMFGDPTTNPKGWPIAPLEALGEISTGKTPPTKNNGMFGGDIPFATPGDLDSGLETTQRTITREGAAFTKIVRAGSALVGCIGSIGKMAKAPVATAFNQQINAVVWGEAVDDEYGVAALSFTVPQMLARASSTTVPILNRLFVLSCG